MLSTTRGLVTFLVLWIGLFILGGYFLFFGNGGAHGIRGSGETHSQIAGHRADTLGADRHAALIAATKRYVAEHPDAAPEIAQGKQLAPREFLNEELSRTHEKFRVRRVEGLEAEIYEVS